MSFAFDSQHRDCQQLGELRISCQPAKAGIPKIEVTFHISQSGILDVKARDLALPEDKQVALKVSRQVSLHCTWTTI